MTEQRDWIVRAANAIEKHQEDESFCSSPSAYKIIESEFNAATTLCDPHCKVPGHVPLREHYRDGKPVDGEVVRRLWLAETGLAAEKAIVAQLEKQVDTLLRQLQGALQHSTEMLP